MKRRQPPLFWLLRRYHSGVLMLVAVGVGIGINLPTAYLRPFTESLHIGGIMLFFWVYAPTAFITRFLTRRAPEEIGIRPMVIIGLACLALSVVLYLVVSSTWHLIIPGLLAGFAHAFLFPSVTGGGSTSFPARYRGIGVTVMLAMYDLGNLIGAPMAGMMLFGAEALGLPPYPSMFLGIAGMLVLICLTYFFNSRHHKGPGVHHEPRRKVRKIQPRLKTAAAPPPGDGTLNGSPATNGTTPSTAAEEAWPRNGEPADKGRSARSGEPPRGDDGRPATKTPGEKCPR